MNVREMAGHVIRRLNQHSTQVFALGAQRAGFHLTPVQFAAMDTIAAHPGIDQAGVAADIAYDRATIGGVIDRLEQKGYVSRNVSPEDRRRRAVWLTDQGEAILQDILPVVTNLQETILPGLEPAERARFLELAGKALGAFGKGEEKKP